MHGHIIREQLIYMDFNFAITNHQYSFIAPWLVILSITTYHLVMKAHKIFNSLKASTLSCI